MDWEPAGAPGAAPSGFPALRGRPGAAPRRPRFRGGIPGGERRRGRGGGGAGPASAYKKGRAPAPVTRLRALAGLRYHGPRPPVRATPAPGWRPRLCRRVGGCWEIPGGRGVDRCLLCSWGLGIGGPPGTAPAPPQLDAEAGETLLETWLRGPWEAPAWGGSSARPARLACGSPASLRPRPAADSKLGRD